MLLRKNNIRATVNLIWVECLLQARAEVVHYQEQVWYWSIAGDVDVWCNHIKQLDREDIIINLRQLPQKMDLTQHLLWLVSFLEQVPQQLNRHNFARPSLLRHHHHAVRAKANQLQQFVFEFYALPDRLTLNNILQTEPQALGAHTNRHRCLRGVFGLQEVLHATVNH